MADSLHQRAQLESLLAALQDLRRDVCATGGDLFDTWRPLIRRRAFLMGAQNLAHYLALRRHDLRPLQNELARWGLSSLGRSESHVIPNLDAVMAVLEAMLSGRAVTRHPRLRTFTRGQRLLERNTERIFGASPERRTRIMVTLPSEAATDYTLIRNLIGRGANVVRINCAHDTPDAWGAMIAHVRRAETELGRMCKVHMDLGGPKPRTGEVYAQFERKLFPGDRLLLTRAVPQPDDGFPFQASCTLPQVLDQVEDGHSVWIDDGKLGAVVEGRGARGLFLRVTHTRAKGERLRPGKGMNFPETNIVLDPLTPDDLTTLDFVVEHADLLGYSFVQSAEDVQHLQDELAARSPHPDRLAVIAKIETRRAVRNLPEIILQAAGRQPFGVMIARGDLAVEIGYERLTEIQEQLLWMCEAAHVPVIWATQVLERYVTKGSPSRGEMTDAAMSARAECVMLNKGDYVVEAVTMLDDILRRMQAHQMKKMPQLRALQSWAEFVTPEP
jgi:pyruvate kinase